MQINTSSVSLTGNTASVCFYSHPSVGNTDRHMVQLRENVSMSTQELILTMTITQCQCGVCGVGDAHGSDGCVAFERAQAA